MGSEMTKISGKKRSNLLRGTQSADDIMGNVGNDSIFGNAGNDNIYGGDGDDQIHGGDGNDTLWGDAGNDTLIGGNGNDLLNGGVGNDKLYGGNGDDHFYESRGTNWLWGDAGNDLFTLTGGANIASGGQGTDTFVLAGHQTSTLAGGAGSDLYIFNIAVGGDGQPAAMPTGAFIIRESFNDGKWGTVDLSSLGLERINSATGKTLSGGPNTEKNDLYVTRVGADLVFDIRYTGGKSLKITFDGAGSNDIMSHIKF